MNRYGAMAQEHWQAVIPDRYAAIPNPQEFFSSLGEQVETRIQQMQDELEPPSQPEQGYLERVGTLSAVRMQAEEIALAELVWIPASQQEISDPGAEPDWFGVMMNQVRIEDQEDFEREHRQR